MDNGIHNNSFGVGAPTQKGLNGESLSIILLYYITAFLITVISIIFISKRI